MVVNKINVILQLAIKDLKLKYDNLSFGYLWMLLNPILMLITLYVVFSFVIKLEVPHYQIFLLLGIIVWNFFSDATTSATRSLVESLSMMKKIKIQPYYIIIASNISSLIDFSAKLIVLLLMMLLFNINIFTFLRLMSLFYFALLFLVILGVSFFISTIYLYYRDILHIWNFLLIIGFWISPVIYSEKMIPPFLIKLYMLNPIARILSHLRNTIIYNYMDSSVQIMISILIACIVFFTGMYIYKRYSNKIYDLL